MKEAIRSRALELGFDDCRFTTAARPESTEQFHRWLKNGMHGQMGYLERNTHKRADLSQVLPEVRSVIVLATAYDGPAAPGAENGTGRVAAYARHADYHDVLGARLKVLCDFLTSTNPAARSLWYVDTGPILERDLAQRAGLGFVGKHTNLISRRLGNWTFLSEILTTLELEPDAAERNRCGSCTRCITACPTAAITAPFQLDARRCISYLTIELKGSIPVELRPLLGNRIYGCDDCLAACPWNKFAQAGRLMREHARADLSAPQLKSLLALDEMEFKKRFAGTPLLRSKRRGLLRNVCVALGNIGDQADLPPLQTAASDPEPIIAEHAAWAIEQVRHRAKAS
jgi:epoxyqueuosine reductase